MPNKKEALWVNGVLIKNTSSSILPSSFPFLFFITAACLACGNFISCFPEESRTFMDELFPLFLKNLEDSIPSVRQGGAVAIASIFKAYGKYGRLMVWKQPLIHV